MFKLIKKLRKLTLNMLIRQKGIIKLIPDTSNT